MPTKASGNWYSLAPNAVILMVLAKSAVCPPLVTRSVKLYVPGVVAMPMRPLAPAEKQHDGGSVRIDIPGGSDPANNDHTYVPFPPVAVNGVSICPTLHVPKFDGCVWATGGETPSG